MLVSVVWLAIPIGASCLMCKQHSSNTLVTYSHQSVVWGGVVRPIASGEGRKSGWYGSFSDRSCEQVCAQTAALATTGPFRGRAPQLQYAAAHGVCRRFSDCALSPYPGPGTVAR